MPVVSSLKRLPPNNRSLELKTPSLFHSTYLGYLSTPDSHLGSPAHPPILPLVVE